MNSHSTTKRLKHSMNFESVENVRSSNVVEFEFELCHSPRNKLENVSIANALQLEAARHCAVPIRFYTSPVASLKSLNLSVAVFTVDIPRCAVTLNFDPVTLTFDL